MKRFLRPLIGALMLASASLSASPGLAAPSSASDGYFNWARIGASPVARFQGGNETYQPQARSQILTAMGYTGAEVNGILQKFASKDCVAGTIKAGDTFKRGSFIDRNGNIKVTGRVRLTDKSEPTFAVCRVYFNKGDEVNGYKYTRDIAITLVYKCRNVVEEEAPPPRPAPPPPPPEKEVPPPVEEASPLIPPSPVKERNGCGLDPKLVIGQEYEPKHHGNRAESSFLSGALYCTWRGKNGTHGIGAGIQASAWNGRVNLGKGKFEGELIAVGPAYEYISDDGWDIEAKLLGGRLNERFNQGDYHSKRSFGIVGGSLSYNNYQRRLRGEKWLPETQAFGFIGIPVSRNAEHSWQGKPITDTRDLSRLGVLAQAGVRQWLYDGKVVAPYVQVGTFLETPGNWSGSARIGIADKNRICGVGVGIDVDFLKGGSAFGLGWWCDVVRGLKFARTGHRRQQMIRETGVIDAGHGIMMVPLTRAPPAIPAQPIGEAIAVGKLTN